MRVKLKKKKKKKKSQRNALRQIVFVELKREKVSLF